MSILSWLTSAPKQSGPELGSTKEVDGFLFQWRESYGKGGRHRSWRLVETHREADAYRLELAKAEAYRKANS